MAVHLAILKPFYLGLILEGKKTVECRLTRTPKPPFQAVQKKDRIYLKQSSGPVVGLAIANRVICQAINSPNDLSSIKKEFGQRILAKDEFWKSASHARYCTLVFLKEVQTLPQPFRINKKDMRAWVVLDGNQSFDFPPDMLGNNSSI